MRPKKIALLFISLNYPYWPFLKDVIEDAQKNFLKNHKVDFFVWSDIPEIDSTDHKKIIDGSKTEEEVLDLIKEDFKATLALNPKVNIHTIFQEWNKQRIDFINECSRFVTRESLDATIKFLRGTPNITVFPTDPVPWPAPTLMRYHLFLQQEEKLKDYDYIFYLDADMRIVDSVTDEILGEGLTMAEHPMYSLRREYIPPYEPNRDSTAYVPRLGVIIPEEGKARFKPLYAAGGFQGGTTGTFISAMKKMRDNIDQDFNNNYVAIWNDESHWNKYLFDYTGHLTVLSPSYVYPDSLINEYYVKIWGKNYKPIIITITKKFTTTREGAKDLNQRLSTM